MGFWNWLKNIFRKKEKTIVIEKPVEKIFPREKLSKPSPEKVILPEVPKTKENKPEEISFRKSTKQEKSSEEPKSEFKSLLADLEEHRTEIVQDKEDRKLKIFEKDEENYFIQLDKKVFVFDEEGWSFFQEEFNMPKYELSVEYERNSYYLIRKDKKTGIKYSFHRLFMNSEIEDFCMKNNCEPCDVEVHHKHSSGNNRKDNMEVLTFKEHRKRHNPLS